MSFQPQRHLWFLLFRGLPKIATILPPFWILENTQGQSHPQPLWVMLLCRLEFSKVEVCARGTVWDPSYTKREPSPISVWEKQQNCLLHVRFMQLKRLKMHKHRAWVSPHRSPPCGWFMAILNMWAGFTITIPLLDLFATGSEFILCPPSLNWKRSDSSAVATFTEIAFI